MAFLSLELIVLFYLRALSTAFLYAFYLFLLLFHVNTIPSSGCSWNESEVMKVKENQTETDHPWCFAKEKLQ